MAEDYTSTFSQLEKGVLHVLILIPRKYSQELMDILLDHWKRSRRKSVKYTSSDHSLDTVSVIGELASKPFL